MPAATARLLLAALLLVAAPAVAPSGATVAELEATFAEDVVLTNGSPERSNTTLVVDAPGDETVYIDSPSFDARTLAGIFGGEIVGDRVRVPLPPDGRIDADFRCVESTEATFTVTGVDSGSSDEATIRVHERPVLRASFPETVVIGTPGETVDVPIHVDDPCTDRGSVTVRVGSEETGFLATAEIVDDGSGNVTLTVATDVPANASARDVMSVKNGTLVNATLHALPRERPLQPGEYPISLYYDGSEVDIGTLVVREPTPTASPTATSTPGTARVAESSPTGTTQENGPDDTSTAVPGFGIGLAVGAVTVGGWIARPRAS